MKRIFFCLICFIYFATVCYAQNEKIKKIECNMYCKTQIGMQYREDFTTSVFLIDDSAKEVYLYADGQKAWLFGDVIKFDNNEILITNIDYGKEKAELNINRQSGSIFFKRVLPNKWTGNLVSTYRGTCSKLENQKF